MKTTINTTGSLPRPGRVSLYICAVIVLCFLNWIALQAQDPKMESNATNNLLVITVTEENEPAIQVQDWMLDFEDGYMAVDEEPEIIVEPWMLTFGHEYMASNDESEINFEPWMINFEQRCLVVDEEQEHQVECWMVCTSTWECARLFARK
jgi:hypothetical protein